MKNNEEERVLSSVKCRIRTAYYGLVRIRILVIDIQISEFKEFMLAKNSGNAGIDFLFSVYLFQIIQDILI